MKKRLYRILTPLIVFAAGSWSARADYDFMNIADNSGPFLALGAQPSINNNGVVGFYARFDLGGEGIFRGNGGAITTIASSGGTFTDISRNVSISDSGVLAFYGTLATGPSGIFTGSGGTITKIADNTAGAGTSDFNGFSAPPSINANGTVAFFANRTGSVTGIYAGNETAYTTITDTSGPLTLLGRPSLNDFETVAFPGSFDAGGTAIFRHSGGPLITLADTSGPFSQVHGDVSLNNFGTAAFYGLLDAGGGAIAYSNGGAPVIIADTFGPFSSFLDAPSINDNGTVAFLANLDAGGNGIFTGPNPATDKVIATGDALFGSTVTSVTSFFTEGLNNSGQVAFSYELANGVKGIAVASVPEPSSVVFLISGLALFQTRRRRAEVR